MIIYLENEMMRGFDDDTDQGLDFQTFSTNATLYHDIATVATKIFPFIILGNVKLCFVVM